MDRRRASLSQGPPGQGQPRHAEDVPGEQGEQARRVGCGLAYGEAHGDGDGCTDRGGRQRPAIFAERHVSGARDRHVRPRWTGGCLLGASAAARRASQPSVPSSPPASSRWKSRRSSTVNEGTGRRRLRVEPGGGSRAPGHAGRKRGQRDNVRCPQQRERVLVGQPYGQLPAGRAHERVGADLAPQDQNGHRQVQQNLTRRKGRPDTAGGACDGQGGHHRLLPGRGRSGRRCRPGTRSSWPPVEREAEARARRVVAVVARTARRARDRGRAWAVSVSLDTADTMAGTPCRRVGRRRPHEPAT